MKINVHTHVHNLQSIFTRETLRIMGLRAEKNKYGKLIVEALDEVLQKIDEMDDPDLVAVIFGESIANNKELKNLLKAVGLKDTHVSHLVKRLKESIRGNSDFKSIRAAFEILDALLAPDAKKDTDEETIGDFLDFLRIGLLPTIDDVTDELMGQLRRGDACVPLMMDIIGTKPTKTDLSLFPKQLADTSRQILRYPGRILPFVKANGQRMGTGNKDSALDYVKQAVEEKGFIGVKMYPSLGYDLHSVDAVLAYCDQASLPVLYHCNRGGFKQGPGAEAFAHPKLWDAVLQNRSKLKVCFAHFGGDECVATHQRSDFNSANWTEVIHALMLKYPGRIFADISYNVLPMSEDQNADNYIPVLRSFLNDPKTQQAILWGTDFFLVRQRAKDINYEAYYRQQLGEAMFKQMAEVNPLLFLGINSLEANIMRHLKYLCQPFEAEWGNAGGILYVPAVLAEVRKMMNAEPPLWRPQECKLHQEIAKYFKGRLAKIYRKDLAKDPDWQNTIADYQVVHLATYTDNFNSAAIAEADTLKRLLRKAGLRLKQENGDWDEVHRGILKWCEGKRNSIGKLATALSNTIQLD